MLQPLDGGMYRINMSGMPLKQLLQPYIPTALPVGTHHEPNPTSEFLPSCASLPSMHRLTRPI